MMASTSKSPRLSEEVKLNEAEDRITNLPEDLISHILSFLPTKWAVASSILSKKWRRMWLSITSVHIEIVDSKGNREFQSETGFIKFVYRVLLSLERSTVNKFCVDCTGVSRSFNASHVSSWVTTALSRNVRQLDIEMPPFGSSCSLPDHLFTCKTLVVLKLGSQSFFEVPSLVCLQNLKTLHLTSVFFGDGDSASRLISSCPVLEDLSLVRCEVYDLLLIKVSAPLLKRLVVAYPEPVPYKGMSVLCYIDSDGYKIELNTPSLVYFQYSGLVAKGYGISSNLTSLVKAHFDFKLCREDTIRTHKTQDTHFDQTQIIKLLQGISDVQNLHVSGNCIESLELYFHSIEEPADDNLKHQFLELPVFHKLTSLELGFNPGFRWKSLTYLLKSSPNLTRLVFEEGLLCYIHFGWDPDNQNWHPPEDVPTCLLFSLEIIDIQKFHGQLHELKLVKYFLSNAKVLKTLNIRCEKNRMKGDVLQVWSKLMEIPRYSKSCEVVVS